jgi:hypothetical protein
MKTPAKLESGAFTAQELSKSTRQLLELSAKLREVEALSSSRSYARKKISESQRSREKGKV